MGCINLYWYVPYIFLMVDSKLVIKIDDKVDMYYLGMTNEGNPMFTGSIEKAKKYNDIVIEEIVDNDIDEVDYLKTHNYPLFFDSNYLKSLKYKIVMKRILSPDEEKTRRERIHPYEKLRKRW